MTYEVLECTEKVYYINHRLLSIKRNLLHLLVWILSKVAGTCVRVVKC